MYERLKRKLEEEKRRHEEALASENKLHENRVKQIEEEIKQIEKRQTEQEIFSEEKIKPVPTGEQTVYLVPDKTDESYKDLEKDQNDSTTKQKVYMMPEKTEEKQTVYMLNENNSKKRVSRFKKFFKRLFGHQEETLTPSHKAETPVPELQAYIPKETQEEKIEQLDVQDVYIMSEKEGNKYSYGNDSIINYARKIKNDKEKHKKLKEDWLKAYKTGNKKIIEEAKNLLWESQNKITLAESFLRSKLKEIRNSSLSPEEKTKLINYVCGIARIKAKEKPAHMKENKEEVLFENTIEELNRKKEKINNSKHFTHVQRRQIIQEIDDEILALSQEESSIKSR